MKRAAEKLLANTQTIKLSIIVQIMLLICFFPSLHTIVNNDMKIATTLTIWTIMTFSSIAMDRAIAAEAV